MNKMFTDRELREYARNLAVHFPGTAYMGDLLSPHPDSPTVTSPLPPHPEDNFPYLGCTKGRIPVHRFRNTLKMTPVCLNSAKICL